MLRNIMLMAQAGRISATPTFGWLPSPAGKSTLGSWVKIVKSGSNLISVSTSAAGAVYVSSDNGASWTQVILPVSFTARGMSTFGSSGVLLTSTSVQAYAYSTDNGASWQGGSFPSTGSRFASVYDPINNRVIVASELSTTAYYSSASNMLSWSAISLNDNAAWRAAATNQLGVIVFVAWGRAGLSYSTNGGNSFTHIALSQTEYVTDAVYGDSGGFIASVKYESNGSTPSTHILRSTNGYTWSTVNVGISDLWETISYFNGHYYLLSNSRTLTSTNGVTWTDLNSPVGISPSSATATNNGYMIAVGGSNSFRKTPLL